MHVGTHRALAGGKICMALLLGAVPIALVFPGGDVALSQTGTGNVAQAPLFTALDLTPDGFATSEAFATSTGQQVGSGVGPVTGNHIHAIG